MDTLKYHDILINIKCFRHWGKQYFFFIICLSKGTWKWKVDFLSDHTRKEDKRGITLWLASWYLEFQMKTLLPKLI